MKIIEPVTEAKVGIMSNELEDTAAAAAETVAASQTKLAEIEAEIADQNHTIAIAKQQRERHAFSASTLADAHAIAMVEEARAQQAAAEKRLADLSNLRWHEARLELDAAERVLSTARRNLARPHVEALMRKRIAAGALMDKALAEVEAAFELHQRLGHELMSYNVVQDSTMTTQYEGCVGLRRIFAALPECIKSLPAHSTKFVPLAESERQFLNLPPEETTTTKAA
jgi:hypothetical protein